MGGESRIDNLAITDIQVVVRNVAQTVVVEGLRAPENGYVVIVDENGQPTELLGPAGASTAYTVNANRRIHDIFDDLQVLQAVFEGAQGLVVVDEGQIVGVLEKNTIQEYLYGRSEAPPKLLGDDALAGDLILVDLPIDAPGATMLSCSTCGAENDVVTFVENETLCRNGHLLTVDWG